MNDLSPAISAIAMLASFALVWGGIVLVRRRSERHKGVLMIVAALVLIGNVLIWTSPMAVKG